MSMETYGVILTFSTGHAIRAERVLKKAGMEVKLIPVPRHLSSDCGTSVRIRQEDRESAARVLSEQGVPFDRYEPL